MYGTAALCLLAALVLVLASFKVRSRRPRWGLALTSMAFSFAALVVASSSVGCAARGPNYSRTRSPHVQNLNAVAITVMCDDASTFIGTGVAVGPRQVLTAAHVVNACGKEPLIVMVEHAGETYLADIDATAPRADVARIEILLGSLPLDHPVSIGPTPLTDAKVCVTARNPYTMRRCGVVEYVSDEAHGIRFDVVVEPGNSGSALYDAQGRLVGIVTKLYFCQNGQICGGMATPLASRPWVLTW